MTTPKLATARSGWGGRGYYIPGRTFEDLEGNEHRLVYPSVTTVLTQVAKPALLQWVADQTAAAAVVNLPYLMLRNEDVGWGFLRFMWSRKADLDDPIRSRYMRVRDDAAELGTNIHEWIEAHLDEFATYPEIVGTEVDQMIEQFLIWLETHDVIPHRAEFTVVNDMLGVAGTADADWEICCMHDGPTCLGQAQGEYIRTLIDLKSSRYTWREHGMQLAALGSANSVMREVPEGTEGAIKHERAIAGKKDKSWWVEDAMPRFSCYALLHIRPTDLDTKGNEIPAFCKLVDQTEDLDLHMMGFEGAMNLARSEYQLNQRAKVRKKETEEDFYG